MMKYGYLPLQQQMLFLVQEQDHSQTNEGGQKVEPQNSYILSARSNPKLKKC